MTDARAVRVAVAGRTDAGRARARSEDAWLARRLEAPAEEGPAEGSWLLPRGGGLLLGVFGGVGGGFSDGRRG